MAPKKRKLEKVGEHKLYPSDWITDLVEITKLWEQLDENAEELKDFILKHLEETLESLKQERLQDKEAFEEELTQLRAERERLEASHEQELARQEAERERLEASHEQELAKQEAERERLEASHKQELANQKQQLEARNLVLIICAIALFFSLVVSAVLLYGGGVGRLTFSDTVMGILAGSILAEVVALFAIPLKYYHPEVEKKETRGEQSNLSVPETASIPSSDGSGQITPTTFDTTPQSASGQSQPEQDINPEK